MEVESEWVETFPMRVVVHPTVTWAVSHTALVRPVEAQPNGDFHETGFVDPSVGMCWKQAAAGPLLVMSLSSSTPVAVMDYTPRMEWLLPMVEMGADGRLTLVAVVAICLVKTSKQHTYTRKKCECEKNTTNND